MNDQPDLLPVSPSAPPALVAARAALANAQKELEAATAATNVERDYLYQRINAAEAVVARMERAEAAKLTTKN